MAAIQVVVRKILVKVPLNLLEKPYLLLAEQNRFVLGLFFKPQQPLMMMREVVSRPDPTYARGAYAYALKEKFVGNALATPGRTLQTQGQLIARPTPPGRVALARLTGKQVDYNNKLGCRLHVRSCYAPQYLRPMMYICRIRVPAFLYVSPILF